MVASNDNAPGRRRQHRKARGAASPYIVNSAAPEAENETRGSGDPANSHSYVVREGSPVRYENVAARSGRVAIHVTDDFGEPITIRAGEFTTLHRLIETVIEELTAKAANDR